MKRKSESSGPTAKRMPTSSPILANHGRPSSGPVFTTCTVIGSFVSTVPSCRASMRWTIATLVKDMVPFRAANADTGPSAIQPRSCTPTISTVSRAHSCALERNLAFRLLSRRKCQRRRHRKRRQNVRRRNTCGYRVGCGCCCCATDCRDDTVTCRIKQIREPEAWIGELADILVVELINFGDPQFRHIHDIVWRQTNIGIRVTSLPQRLPACGQELRLVVGPRRMMNTDVSSLLNLVPPARAIACDKVRVGPTVMNSPGVLTSPPT